MSDVSPRQLAEVLGKPGPRARREIEAAEEARRDGFREGLRKGRQEIIDFLQHAYIEAPDRPDRGTPRAEALLQVARDASLHFRELAEGRRA